MPNRIPDDCQKFRPGFLPLAILIFAAIMLFSFCGITVCHGLPFFSGMLKFAISFAAGWAIFWSWVISLLFPEAFSNEGVYGHSVWGNRRFVRWQDIKSARKLRIANLSWLRIYAANGQVTWLALFPMGKAQFQREIMRLAPPDSPVLPFISDF